VVGQSVSADGQRPFGGGGPAGFHSGYSRDSRAITIDNGESSPPPNPHINAFVKAPRASVQHGYTRVDACQRASVNVRVRTYASDVQMSTCVCHTSLVHDLDRRSHRLSHTPHILFARSDTPAITLDPCVCTFTFVHVHVRARPLMLFCVPIST
jgi:hypothetical protein